MNALKPYLTRKMMVIFLLGISSGFPRALCAGTTLKIWLAEGGLTLENIGLASIIGLPYILKFLWSPLFDAVKIPFLSNYLGKRRAWIIIIQILLLIMIILLGATSPGANALYTAIFAFITAFLSASQDINIDAYRVEFLDKEEYGYGSATAVLSYRIGMIISGAGALYLANYGMGWHLVYALLSLTVLFGMAGVFMGSKPLTDLKKQLPQGFFKHYIIDPFRDFASKNGWLIFLLLIVLYKLPDAMLGSLSSVFYLQTGFSKSEIGTVIKLFGITATIFGSLAGGIIITRFGVYRSLLTGCLLQALTVLFFSLFAAIGKDHLLFVTAVGAENFAGGIGDICLVVFISNLCNKEFTATQYALLTSFSGIGIILCGAISGFVAAYTGWMLFFAISAATAIPGLAALYLARDKIRLLTGRS